MCGVGESDTGLAPSAMWDLAADKQALRVEMPLMVGDCFFITHCLID